MDAEDIMVTPETFQEEVVLLMSFGLKGFSHKFFNGMPNPPLFDNLLKDLVHNLIDFYKAKEELIRNLNGIAERSIQFEKFHKSILELITIINNPETKNSDKWEIISDLLEFYKALLERQIKSLEILKIDNQEYNEELNIILPTLKESLIAFKPEGAKDSRKISLNLEDFDVANRFNAYVKAQMSKYNKCKYCIKPATYFFYPCSHALACDEDYAAIEGTVNRCMTCNNSKDLQIVHIKFNSP